MPKANARARLHLWHKKCNTLQSGRVCRLACAQFVSKITIEQFFGVCVCVSVSGLLFLFILRIHRMFTTKTKQYRNVLFGSVSKNYQIYRIYTQHMHIAHQQQWFAIVFTSICRFVPAIQHKMLAKLFRIKRNMRQRAEQQQQKHTHKKMADVTVHRYFVCRKPNK